MLRYMITKTQYKKIFDGFVKNITVCSSTKQTQHQKIHEDKYVRLDENSLQPRILKYFKECSGVDLFFNQQPITNEYWNNLNGLSNDELLTLILTLKEENFRRRDFKIRLQYLDKECCSRMVKLSPSEMFKYLHNFMIVIPHLITKLNFYNKSVYKLSFIIDHCSKIELLQVCFYVALQKKTKTSRLILKDCLKKFTYQHLDNLNINDLVILCNSSYKTSTKIGQRKLLDLITNTLYNNLNILNDTTVFITIIKTLRHNQSQDEELLSTISSTIFFNNTFKNYNFTASSHILALYSDSLHYDENLFSLITNNCIAFLRESGPVISNNEYFIYQIRVKDVARFVWSLSYVNYENLNENDLTKYVWPLLQSHIDIGSLDKNIEYFVDSVLSMWILGYKPTKNFLTSIINKNTMSLIYGKGKKRYVARLNLLLTCIQWEKSEMIPIFANKPEPWNKSNQLRNRPYLKIVHSALNNISSKVDVQTFELSSPVPYLNIIGFTGIHKNNKVRVYVELVDDLMLVKNRDCVPHGLMKLKIRLLESLQKPVLVVFQTNIENLKQRELENYLQKKLKLLLCS